MYDRLQLFTDRESSRDHEVALARLFDLMEAGSRQDIKSDLLLELDRQRQTLEALADNPDVAPERLTAVLNEVQAASSALHGYQVKFGQHLRDNEWLMAIRSRFNIPGGGCEFDLPGFRQWLQQPSFVRHGHLIAWQEPLTPVKQAVKTVLKLLRQGGVSAEHVAVSGQFQQMPMARAAQLLRVEIDEESPCVPEVSANKYALNIRFLSNLPGMRPSPHAKDVRFKITYCNF
jgi:cell division protein ZapD